MTLRRSKLDRHAAAHIFVCSIDFTRKNLFTSNIPNSEMFLFLLGGSSDSDTEQNHTANSIMDRTDRPDSDALITTNDTTNAITSAPSTLTADGHLIQDQYWLLKSYRSQRRSFLNHHSNREYTVSPITLVPCDLATYQRTPKMHDQVRRICNVMSESFHGRRVNDEVELFAMEDGKVRGIFFFISLFLSSESCPFLFFPDHLTLCSSIAHPPFPPFQ